jgi:ABC-type lipoprotein export system ATPase subunit
MSLGIAGLQHTYTSPAGETRKVLDIGDYALADGDQLLLRGVSGSGKTTFFNILAGLLHPSQGQVLYDEKSLYSLREAERDRFRARHVGYVFQNHMLLPSLTALDNVMTPLAFAGSIPSGERKERARSLLAQLGIAEYAGYRPRALSTGQRLRVAIARALANSPSVLLADEPTAALDSAAAGAVMDLLQQSCREHQSILVVSSHDPALDSRFERVVDLRQGRLIAREVAS